MYGTTEFQLADRTLRFDLHDMLVGRYLFRQIFNNREYTCVPGFDLHPEYTVLDIGANVGLFAVFAAAQCSDGAVYAFEPATDNFKRLQKHLEMNQIDNVVTRQCAVFSGQRHVKLYKPHDEGAYSLYEENARLYTRGRGYQGDFEIVPTASLAELFDRHNIGYCDYMKIDCEGAEWNILSHASEELLRSVCRIVLEWHPNVSVERIESHLHDHGFQTCRKFVRWKNGDKSLQMGTLFANRIV